MTRRSKGAGVQPTEATSLLHDRYTNSPDASPKANPSPSDNDCINSDSDTAIIVKRYDGDDDESSVTEVQPPRPLFSPLRRVLFVALVSATSFAFTQTSLIYAFRVMTCDDYFEHTHGVGSEGGHAIDYVGEGDRCAVPVVESRTARAIALMSTMTTFCCTSGPDSNTYLSRFAPSTADPS